VKAGKGIYRQRVEEGDIVSFELGGTGKEPMAVDVEVVIS